MTGSFAIEGAQTVTKLSPSEIVDCLGETDHPEAKTRFIVRRIGG
jgi:hypothetical protein